MTEGVARIPLARSRRRRPKPPQYWMALAMFVGFLAIGAISAVRALRGDKWLWLYAGAFGELALVELQLMRFYDPDDDYSVYQLTRHAGPLIACAVVLVVTAGVVLALGAIT